MLYDQVIPGKNFELSITIALTVRVESRLEFFNFIMEQIDNNSSEITAAVTLF